MVTATLCSFLLIGLVQVVRPQLLWKADRPPHRPFVSDYDATQPTGKGYPVMRTADAVFLGGAIRMLVHNLQGQ